MFIQTKQYWIWILATSCRTILCISMNIGDERSNQDYLINTPGCYIPNYLNSVLKPTVNFPPNITHCGERAVFIRSMNNNKIQFRIHYKKLEKYAKAVLREVPDKRTKPILRCCFQFGQSTATAGDLLHKKLSITKCRRFKSGTKVRLWYEVILISCFLYPNKLKIYEDAYITIKRKDRSHVPIRNKNPWNVLLIGMDTMSRARILSTMPLTSKYLQEQDWLDYKGYHKVADNSFPNLMAALTGLNESSVALKCRLGLSKCLDYFVWTKYHNAGYKTAFGEDYLALGDTFSKFNGFKKQPTDHYMQPFYFMGESHKKSILCMKKKPSATHMLQYAYNFVRSYLKDNFFGMFWINSFSHNEGSNPSLIDKDIVHFFGALHRIGVMNNTFVIFFSDHGVRFGKNRFSVASYYGNRLPMLFIWTPYKFRKIFQKRYNTLQSNQDRLTTPYDLYVTLTNILRLSVRSRYEVKYRKKSAACPNCISLFKNVSLNRTCEDAAVTEVWCGCHNLTKTDNNRLVERTMVIIRQHLLNLMSKIKTERCTHCQPMKELSIMRSHTYSVNNKTYHVVAFRTSQTAGYEATVVYYNEQKNGKLFQVLSLESITGYKQHSTCVLNESESLRAYCWCQPTKTCEP